MVNAIIIIGLALGKKYSQWQMCSFIEPRGDRFIPMHLQYLQTINISNTFHMFTITESCNTSLSLEGLRWKSQCLHELSSGSGSEMSDRWSPASPLPAPADSGQAERVRRFFFSCSLRFPGLPFFSCQASWGAAPCRAPPCWFPEWGTCPHRPTRSAPRGSWCWRRAWSWGRPRR